jgi:CubicO group peptidase (beta-lactamase class C family)
MTMSVTAEQSPPVPAQFQPLHDKVTEAMERLHVPGVAVGIMVDGREHVAGFGLTNVNYPAAVLPDTLFQICSTTKTITATAVMVLVEAGSIDLDAPVRRYLPDLRLRDSTVAEQVTPRQLLNHTAGWTGDYFSDTGRGEEALAKIVLEMAELEQVTPLGEIWSYNNAGFYLLGRILESVTGKPYEVVVRELVLEPLGMADSFFFPEEVMVRSFAVGHNVVDGKASVTTPWPIPRSANPAGGITATAADQLRYARFHLGDGTAEDGTRVLQAATLREMQTPTVAAGPGVRMGLSWFIRDVEGVRIVQHGGDTNGQSSSFAFAPEKQFALTILTNANVGGLLHGEVETWALKHYLGIAEPETVHLQRSATELAEYAGKYETALVVIDAGLDGDRLILTFELAGQGQFPSDDPPQLPPPTPAAFWTDDGIITLDGPIEGTKGEFLRDADGRLAWFRFGGRLYRRRD